MEQVRPEGSAFNANPFDRFTTTARESFGSLSRVAMVNRVFTQQFACLLHFFAIHYTEDFIDHFAVLIQFTDDRPDRLVFIDSISVIVHVI